VGLIYYRVAPNVLDDLRPLIAAHEGELVGPRARGYWFDRPEEYDYAGVRATAAKLDEIGRAKAVEVLELSEVQAHSLSLLDVELPADGLEFPPALFMSSATPAILERNFKLARRRLGNNPDEIAAGIRHTERDPRFTDYLDKQLRHLREALPLVWRFHERAAEAGDSVLVIDLRARDLEIPEEFELASMS
jgi:hypothetical protein